MGRQTQLFLKRLLDMLIALAALIALAPVISIIAFAIKREDGGPVFFVQERVGKDGKPFQCGKFRTMIVNADKIGAGLEILKDDKRITRVGRSLRRWTLDEIPQLLNVLKGEMSIIGPRPTVVSQVARYTTQQRRRLEMKPGMAGWAWIHGRNTLPWANRIQLDVWYVEHWSLRLDAIIFFKAFLLLLRREGVYTAEGTVRDLEQTHE